MRFRLACLIPALAMAATLVVAAACNDQSEGYPCDPHNGNNDCSDGLACVATPNTRATNAGDVCCPVAPAQPTTSACSQSNLVDAGNPAVPEASVREAASPSEASSPSGDGASSQDSASPSGDSASPDAGPG
jgi:hypothetical protein